MNAMKIGKTTRLLAATAALALVGPGLAWAQSPGDCLRVEVPSPMVLPDGSVHPAGTLELCMSGTFSPVAALHTTRIEGATVGLLLSRRGKSEEPVRDDPYVLFHRTPEGSLELLGYAWPDGKTMNTYLMKDFGGRATGKHGGRTPSATTKKATVDLDDRVILTARVR